VGDPFFVEREMACTREDLARWLPGVSAGVPARRDGDDVILPVGGGEVRIGAEERALRRVGHLSLPVLLVRFRFDGVDDGAREAFLARFDLFTRRGGG
jgi:hypothetical protein